MKRSTRNIEIWGRRTSFRLEEPFWVGLERCARDRGVSITTLITDVVDAHRDSGATMSSALRVFVIQHFQNLTVNRKSA